MEKKMILSRGVLIIAALAVISAAGCKKEEKPSAKTDTQAVSTYASDTVYLEVKKKLEQNPKDADAWYHLADLYDRNAQYAEAVDSYKKVIELKPDMGYAYLKMGTAYDRMNKPDEAIETLKKAAKYMPDYPLIYNNMGVAYGKLGKFREETAALKKALKLRPSYSTARFNLGMTYMKLKDRKSALAEYESLKKYDEGAAENLMKEINAAGQSK